MPAPTKKNTPRILKPSTTVSARRKLELSQLTQQTIQQELMHPDVDLEKFVLYFSSQVLTNMTDRVVDASISRTIDASSQLQVTVNDYDRALLNSGYLSDRLDVQIENLWFRLKGLEKQGDNLILNFEDREIAVLRTYSKWKIANRASTTRAEFILSIIREVKEFVIPVVIPELRQIQPIQRYSDDTLGIDAVYNKTKSVILNPKKDIVPAPKGTPANVAGVTKFHVTVKNVPITQEQLTNAQIILSVGESMMSDKNPQKSKILICSIMTAIDESVLQNIDHGDRDSVGLFQQRDSWGSYNDRMDPETSARLFFNQCIPAAANNPSVDYNDLCQLVQRSGTPYAYGQYRWEAQAICNYCGHLSGPNGAAAAAFTMNGQQPKVTKNKSGDYFYWRGTIYDRNSMKFRKPENSWSCIQRLAQEVGWYAFFVSGTFYYLSEDDMLTQSPLMSLTEFIDGINSIDGDYDNQKKSATLTIGARVGKWAVPPGSLVVVEGMGPWNGRWIVSDFERNLFDLNATITLTKGSPSLPEPYGGDQNQLLPGWFPQAATSTTAGTVKQQSPLFGGIPGTNGSRDSIVKVAMQAYAVQKKWPYHYLEARPMPSELFSAVAHNPGIDCSTFATLVYKEANVTPDPNGYGYNGSGNTDSLQQHGTPVASPSPGDLVFYGSPSHVAVYVGNGNVIEIGSNQGITMQTWTYRPPTAIRSYLSLV